MQELLALIALSHFSPEAALSTVIPSGCSEQQIIANLQAVRNPAVVPGMSSHVSYEARLARGQILESSVLGQDFSFKNPARTPADLYLLVGTDSHKNSIAWGVLADPSNCKIIRARELFSTNNS